ncbi:MAG: SGNH/GDSL hydrolase family protein [Planctomycetota bacterium]|jgi:hypothetical protein
MILLKTKVTFLFILCVAVQVIADDGIIIRKNQRTLDQIERIYSEMPPISYMPPSGRLHNLPRTRQRLTKGGTLRVVMLGDSIVNDTSRSCWNLLLEREYPNCRIEKITSVRGSTGCWWYKEFGRVQKFVLDHKPELVIIGGISQRGDIDSIREVIRQIRSSCQTDILLMTGAFGQVEPSDESQWKKISDPNHFSDYRKGIEKLAIEVGAAFLDLETAWAKYIHSCGRDLEWFKRDPIHANERGEQILGHILTAYISPLAVEANSPRALNIDSRLELFVDDLLIEQMKGVELTLHRPVCREVVIVHDKPWEGNTCGYHTVFKDGDLYRMYYRGWNHDSKTQKQLHEAVVCYAESSDGIHWKRPSLGLVDFNGSRDNNIILKGPGSHNFTPFKDANPNCTADERYKAVARGEDDGNRKLFAFQSPDGIHWQFMQSEPIITEGAFDSQNLAFWDSVRNEYRSYFRDFHAGVRDIKTSTSKDFIHWTKPVWLQYPGAPKEHLYTNQIQPYYRAPHIFIGMPTRYIPERGSLTEGLLMTSRDGKTFHRWSEAIVRPGRNRDKWHNRSNYIWLGIVETESSLPGAGKELSIYSNERYYNGPGVKTRRYTYRIDGFVSVRAVLSGGEFVTKPLVFAGSDLMINFSTSAAGSIRVEIQDMQGNPFKGFGITDSTEIYGDEIEYRVRWKDNSDLSKLTGKVVRLRFEMRDADLYSIQFR